MEKQLKDAQAESQTHKDNADKATVLLEEEKAARIDVIKRLEEASGRVSTLESQPQVQGFVILD